MAEALSQFADRLEKAENFSDTLHSLVRETYRGHKRIVFNGNSYSEEWTEEAARRGLLNLRTTAEALPCLVEKKNIDLFTRHGIYTETELRSRYEIQMENYCKTLSIEGLTMLDILYKDLLPAVFHYLRDLSGTECGAAKSLAEQVSALSSELYVNTQALQNVLDGAQSVVGTAGRAEYFRDTVIPAMQEARAAADELENRIGRSYWPYPTYGELLFQV